MSIQVSRPPSPQTLSQARVLVVGGVMLDRYWYGAVERISPEAPVPVVRVTREEERIGAAANVAANVIGLGAHATLLTVVGDDEIGRKLEILVAQAGIHPHFAHDPKMQTTVKLRVIGQQQQLLRMDFESVPQTEALSLQTDAFCALLPTHDVVLFSDYGKGSLTHIETMIAKARAAGKPVLIDPKGVDYARYKNATVITPNRAELRRVVGPWKSEEGLQSKVNELRHQLEVEALLLTRSEEGMTLFDAQGQLHENAHASEVFDVTGAGDTVIAVLAALVAAGMHVRQAMSWANLAGGLVVRKFGTANVSYDELFVSVANPGGKLQ